LFDLPPAGIDSDFVRIKAEQNVSVSRRINFAIYGGNISRFWVPLRRQYEALGLFNGRRYKILRHVYPGHAVALEGVCGVWVNHIFDPVD
jgi:hypothetical protein